MKKRGGVRKGGRPRGSKNLKRAADLSGRIRFVHNERVRR